MSREYRLFLEDMLKACEKIVRFTRGLSVEQFQANDQVFDAVLRNLEIIGEAAKHIPPQVRLQHPDIDWRKMSGFRDTAIHEYFGIDIEVVWDIITDKVPVLSKQLKQLLGARCE